MGGPSFREGLFNKEQTKLPTAFADAQYSVGRRIGRRISGGRKRLQTRHRHGKSFRSDIGLCAVINGMR